MNPLADLVVLLFVAAFLTACAFAARWIVGRSSGGQAIRRAEVRRLRQENNALHVLIYDVRDLAHDTLTIDPSSPALSTILSRIHTWEREATIKEIDA